MNRVRVLIIIRYVGGSTAVRAFLCNTNKYKINFKGGKTDSKQRLSLLHPLIPGSLVNETDYSDLSDSPVACTPNPLTLLTLLTLPYLTLVLLLSPYFNSFL